MIEEDTRRWHKQLDDYHDRQRREHRIDMFIRTAQWSIALIVVMWIAWMVWQIVKMRY